MLITISGVDYFHSAEIGEFGLLIADFPGPILYQYQKYPIVDNQNPISDSDDTFDLTEEPLSDFLRRVPVVGPFGDYGEGLGLLEDPVSDFLDHGEVETIESYETLISDLDEEILVLADLGDIRTQENTLKVTKPLHAMSTADFAIIDRDLAFSFEKGQPVTIRDARFITRFTGFIDSVVIYTPDTLVRTHAIKCVGNEYLAQKQLIRHVFEGYTIEGIVRWIYENVLKPEGIELGEIEATGTVLNVKSFDLVTGKDALDDLADIAGNIWLINDYRRFYFVPFDSLDAPLALDGLTTETSPFSDLQVTKEAPDYRNVLTLKGGKAETAERAEYFSGDGTLRTWDLRFPVKQLISVLRNGAPQTVSEQSTGTVCNWSYSANGTTITQDSNEVVLAAGELLEVTYIGQYDLLVRVSDQNAIKETKAIDGGSGSVELVIDAPEYTDEASLIAYGRALLTLYAKQTVTIEYGTEFEDLAEGQTQHISLPALSIDGKFLITQVVWSHENNDFAWRISVTDGAISDLWEKIFGKKPTAPDTQPSSIICLEDFTAKWSYYVYPNPFRPDCDPIKLFQFLELNVSSGAFRVPIDNINLGADEIVVTAMILDSEAVGEVSSVSLWGGQGASVLAGSGEKNWETSYRLSKSAYESIQFEITNIKANDWKRATAPLGGETSNGCCGIGFTNDELILGVA